MKATALLRQLGFYGARAAEKAKADAAKKAEFEKAKQQLGLS